MAENLDCGQMEELIPELATGVAAGDERARALRHVAGCARCRAELSAVTATADALLLLTPEREPPPGFETRVLTGLTTTRQRRPAPPPRRRLRTVLVRAGAAAAIAGLAAGAVWWRTAPDRDLANSYRNTLSIAHGRYLRAAPMEAGATPVGQLFAYEGSPSWIFVIVQEGSWTGRYAVRLHTRDGRLVGLGTMTVHDGEGYWGYSITVPVSEIVSVDLTGPDGPTMTARLG